MIALFEAAKQLQDFSDRQGWRSCFIGGIAQQRWGESHVTRYVNLALLAGFGREDAFIETLLAAYPPRIGSAAEFARRHRVLLLQTQTAWESIFRSELCRSRSALSAAPRLSPSALHSTYG